MKISRTWIAVVATLFVAVLGACGPASDDSAYDPAKAETLIREYSQTWASVAVTGDPSALEEIFADDFIGTDSDGRLYTKREFIENVRSNPANLVSNNVDEVKVRFFDNVAVAQGNETFTQADGLSRRFVWTDIYVFRESRWEMVAAQDLLAPETVDPNAAPFSSIHGSQESQ